MLANYEDKDGYNFLGGSVKGQEDSVIRWEGDIHESFKVLLYIPVTGDIIVSNICEKNFGNTYFIFHMKNEIGEKSVIPVKRSRMDIVFVALLLKILSMIMLELGGAYLFQLKEKNQLIFVSVVSGSTAAVANIYATVIAYQKGSFGFVLIFLIMAMCSGMIKVVAYPIGLKIISEKEIKITIVILYALLLNLLAFMLGLFLYAYLPGIR